MSLLEVYLVLMSFLLVQMNNVLLSTIDIECIPLHKCPIAMKLVSTRKYALETIKFFRNSHCGSSKEVGPLVWCPNLNSCLTPDGQNGTCTDLVHCSSLLKKSVSINDMSKYRCNEYLEDAFYVCCNNQELTKMSNRINEEDSQGNGNKPPWQAKWTTYETRPRNEIRSSTSTRSVGDNRDTIITTHLPTTNPDIIVTYKDERKMDIPTDSPVPDSEKVSDDSAFIYESVSFKNLSILCGRPTSTSDRIIGGTPVDPGDYPWMALLEYNSISSTAKRFGCSGTLINKRYVLTAAHCVDNEVLRSRNLRLFRVLLGEYDTRNVTDCIYTPHGTKFTDPPIYFEIESVLQHERFNHVNGVGDIALIRLNNNVKFTDYIKPICLPVRNLRMRDNESLTVAGWGTTSASNRTTSPVLLKARLPLVDKSACNRYGNTALGSGQLCAGVGSGVDTCKGDSGGPMMVTRTRNFEIVTYQMGIVSYGFAESGGCGNAPSVNTFVPHYIDWIFRNIRQ